ncbi:arylsulfatase [Verrucomicrobia bacterium]|nr:arylsulfatase [Verrucomicrobiota bacterium]MDC0218470.1 arylsulfatase [Verrucomicrobiota bacterium]
MQSFLRFFAVFLCVLCGSNQAEAKQPNIILVITDDQGYGPVGRHGHPWIRTPNLDKLYDASTRFTRFLVSPTCAPTRSAIMTGRHPMKNGVTHTILERERMTLKAMILPQVLKQAGYTSGIFGKWHLGDEEPYQPHTRGFDEAFIHGAGGIGQAYNCSCADAPGNKYFNPVIRHNGSFVKTKGFCTDLFFTSALGWIKSKKDGDDPFFAYITTNAPHGPFIAPPKNTKYFTDLGFGKTQAGFYGMIENIDENMGRLMGKLKEWDLYKDTILIFMSDNGMTGGGSGRSGQPVAKGYPFFNAGMKGLKGSADEGGVRVPFLVRWDGHWKAGRDFDTVSAHIDILPTFAAIAGIKQLPKNQVEGRSLLPLLNGERKTLSDDRYLFTHRARWATGTEPNTHQWKNFAVRSQQWRYIGAQQARKGNTVPGALYDMVKDSGQKENVAEQHPEVVKKMRTAYEQFWKEARPLMVNESAPMSKTRPFHVWFAEQMKKGGIPQWKAPSL